VIASLEGDFDPSELHSEYRRDLRALLEAKQRGEKIVAPEPEVEAPVIDLMEALKASVAAAKTRGDGEKAKATRAKAKPTRRRAKAS
jgi:DNA end-binding protein Ku